MKVTSPTDKRIVFDATKILPTPKFCTACGAPMKWQVKLRVFDQDTGIPMFKLKWSCTGAKWYNGLFHNAYTTDPEGEESSLLHSETTVG